MFMKNSNNTIGNRSRDLPVCSAVPQPLRHRIPQMEYRHNLYSPNITSKLGTLSKAVLDSAGRFCNSVPRSGLKYTYIFFCAFVLRQPTNMSSHCTTKEYDISSCHAEWRASEEGLGHTLHGVSFDSIKP
jgi:hypothetical protein